jgi:hypothetical protein
MIIDHHWIVGDIEKRALDFCATTSSNMGNFFFQSFRKSQQLKKVRFEPGSAFPKPRTGLVVWFCTTIKPWSELWSGSEKFRFELWFRTRLWHPHNTSAQHPTKLVCPTCGDCTSTSSVLRRPYFCFWRPSYLCTADTGLLWQWHTTFETSIAETGLLHIGNLLELGVRQRLDFCRLAHCDLV